MKTRVAIILLVLCSSLGAQAKNEFSTTVFVRNAGIVAAGLLSAFDVLNRILMVAELDSRSATCTDQTCTNAMRELKTLNAVGLGFETLPPLSVLFTALVYLAAGDTCFLLPNADEKTIGRITTLAASMAVVGSAVGTGTAGKCLAIGLGDDGRFIASTILSGASLVVSLFATSAALVIVSR